MADDLCSGEKAFWDAQYREHGKVYGPYPSQSAYDLMRFVLRKRSAGEMLESIAVLGDGVGRNALYFSYMGLRPTIIDFSKVALDLARNDAQRNNLRLDTRLADLTGWVPDRTYDVAFSNFVLHLLPKAGRENAYSNIYAALKSDGYFCSSFLSVDDDEFNQLQEMHGMCDGRDAGTAVGEERTFMLRGKQQHFFTRDEILEELIAAGFCGVDMVVNEDPETIIDISRLTRYFFVVARRD